MAHDVFAGNTTAAFNVNLFLSQANIPTSLQTQLVIYKTYKTPVTVPNGCELRFETRNVLVTNISSPNFIRPAGGTLPDPNDPSEKNPTLWLAPAEVESCLLEHPEVTDVAVIGVEHPTLGQEVKAVVVRSADTLTSDVVRAWAAVTLASFKVPAYVEFLDELPRNATGKVVKQLLIEPRQASTFIAE